MLCGVQLSYSEDDSDGNPLVQWENMPTPRLKKVESQIVQSRAGPSSRELQALERKILGLEDDRYSVLVERVRQLEEEKQFTHGFEYGAGAVICLGAMVFCSAALGMMAMKMYYDDHCPHHQ